MYDFVVVGAGVAGVAVAELLQRSGRSVLLLEAEDRVCRHSSGQQQGWFHTGALYAALPSSRYFRQLVGNLDDLFNYYGAFPGMNLTSGRYLLTRRRDGWFRNYTCYYFYVKPSERAIKKWQAPLWRLATLRAQMRLSWFETVDFNRELSPQIDAVNFTLNLSRSLARRRFDFDLGGIDKVLKSRDRTFDAERLIGDLLSAFLGAGGELELRSPVTRIEKGWVHTEGATHRCRHVVVTAGREIPRVCGTRVRVVKSPILVVRPALSDVNFIRMTPIVEQTLNHLYHDSPEGDYSVFGNASYFDCDSQLDEPALKAELVAKAETAFGRTIDLDQAALYFGYKTESAAGRGLRNYQYQIIEGRDCVVALPGKMSLAFSLAVNLCRHYGIDPATEIDPPGNQVAAGVVARPEHYVRFSALAPISPPAVRAPARLRVG